MKTKVDKEEYRKLSPKEEEIMSCFWQRGPLFVREVVEMMPEPKPHFNTVSTFVRSLEAVRQFVQVCSGGSCRGVSEPLVERVY